MNSVQTTLDGMTLSSADIMTVAESAILDSEPELPLFMLDEIVQRYPKHITTASRAFIHHLQARAIPCFSQPSPSDGHVIDLALISLKGLTTIMILLDGQDAQLRLAWPGIWQWIQFIILHCCTSSALPIQTPLRHKESAYVVSMYFMNYFASMHESFKAQIKTTPGALGLISKWWKEEAQNANGLHFSAGLLISKLVTCDGPDGRALDNTVIGTMLRTAGGDIYKLASYTLDRIRANTKRLPEPDYEAMDGDLTFIILAPLSHIPRIQHAFLSQHSVNVIARAVGRIVLSPVPLTPDTASPSNCLIAALGYLHLHMRIVDSYTWVLHALEAHILPSLLKLGKWPYRTNEVHDLCIELFQTMGPYLAYRSVLRVVSRSLQKIESQQLEANWNQGDKLWSTWMQFKEVAKSRLQLKAAQEGNSPNYGICENVTCPKIDVDDSFKWCQGCLHVHYCGKACQKEDWDRRHRQLCKEIRTRRRDGLREPTSVKDFSFMSELAQAYSFLQQEAIHDLKRKELLDNPSVDYNSLVTVFDFREFPVRIYVDPPDFLSGKLSLQVGYPYKSEPHESEDVKSTWGETVEQARLSKGRHMAARIVVPQAGKELMTYLLLAGPMHPKTPGLGLS